MSSFGLIGFGFPDDCVLIAIVEFESMTGVSELSAVIIPLCNMLGNG
jgi:hypothetical protein